MKKLYFLALSLFLSVSVSAQLTEGFESYPDGPYFGGNWTNWDNSNISVENINVVSTKASQGTKSGYIGGNGQQDPILNVGLKSGGTWTYSMDVFIDTGKSGYFNAQHTLNNLGTDGNWAYEIFFGLDASQPTLPQLPGVATYKVGTNSFTFSYPSGQWFNIALVQNLDNNTVKLYMNGTEIVFQGTLLPFGSNPTFQGKLNGFDYYSASSSMSMYIDNIIFKQGSLGVSDVKKDAVKVYPTLAKDVVNIVAPNAISEISLIDVNGKVLSTQKSNETKTQVDVSNLTSGVYFVKIQSGNDSVTKKIIVK